jgi:xanthine phosphoribosyltransferase
MSNCKTKSTLLTKFFQLLLVCATLSSGASAKEDDSVNDMKELYPPKIRKISDLEIKSNIETLIKNLPETKWNGIIAITNGGLIPTYYLAKLLKINDIKTISIKSYKERKQQENMEISGIPEIPNGGKGWLVVDDLADTGKTLQATKKIFPDAYYVTLFVKPLAKELTNLWGEMVDQETWIEFPWETLFNFN